MHKGILVKTKTTFGEMFVRVVKHIQHFTQQRKTRLVFDPDQTLPNTLPNKCYETKQGGQTSPTFHQTFVFEMLGEKFDLFDRGFSDKMTFFLYEHCLFVCLFLCFQFILIGLVRISSY